MSDKAFGSWSTEHKVAESFAGSVEQPVIYRTTAQPGTKAQSDHQVPTGSQFGKGGNSPEHEVLLPRNTRYKVTAAKRLANGTILIDVEIL
jgi:hypothetical protein